jgi:hypothetical protein
LAEQFGKPLLQGFEMTTDPGPHHDAVRIDGPTVLAVTLAGTDGGEKTVFVKSHIGRPLAQLAIVPRISRSRRNSALTCPFSNIAAKCPSQNRSFERES